MDFVKIRGKDIQDCFMQMKMKYGPEAHVYDQRVITEGGLLGTGLFAKKIYEIAVGIPEQQTSKDRVEKKLQDLKDLLRQKNEDESKKKINDIKPLSDKEEPNKRVKEKNQDNDSSKSDFGLSLKEELSKREIVGNDFDSIHLNRLRDRLVQEGFTKDYVDELMKKVDKHLSFIEKSKSSSVLEKTSEILEERINIDIDIMNGTGRGKRKVVFFIGPTGAGKTTTIAKISAKYFLHKGRMVSLYTTDNYRIAAMEQLKRYADTMEIPFFPIKDPKKFKESLYRDGSELVLIDTAGYSHKNPDFYSKMKLYTECLGEKDQLENILVISGTSSYTNIKSVMSAYEPLGFKRVIVTKLDETDYLSSIVELMDTKNKTFSYLSTGQEVPFDLTPADKRTLAELVMYPERIKELKGEEYSVG